MKFQRQIGSFPTFSPPSNTQLSLSTPHFKKSSRERRILEGVESESSAVSRDRSVGNPSDVGPEPGPFSVREAILAVTKPV